MGIEWDQNLQLTAMHHLLCFCSLQWPRVFGVDDAGLKAASGVSNSERAGTLCIAL
jgi:hypothetical protein